MKNVTRKGFLAATAVSAGLVGLAGCEAGGAGTDSADPLAAPDAASYPIEPDGEGVEATWASETSRKDKWTRVTNADGGAELGVMDTAKIIQVGGYAFRDMNGNGKLDLWEDWRQTSEARGEALANELSIEEIAPVLFHGGLSSTVTPLDEASQESLGEGVRAGVSRASANEDNYVEAITWINAVQEWIEANDPQGIPYLNSSDPYQLYDIPDPHGLASAFDPDLWRRAGHFIGRAYRATGVRVDLGPQVDVCSNVTYARTSGSVCEDPATNRDMCAAFSGGMQSTWDDAAATGDQGWGKDSCSVMLKHYVGAGAVEGGRNDHQEAGKYNIFPTDSFNAHLIPFLDGGLNLDSKTGQVGAIMTNYGIAYSENGDEYGGNVAGSYNKRNVGVLRNAGWDGMICTDWGVFQDNEDGGRPWGVEDLTMPERFEKMLDVTVDQVGGDFFPDEALEAYELMKASLGEDEATAAFRTAARRILTLMARVQLLDNPYSDREYAKEVLEDAEAADFAQEAADKCVVMLKNKGGLVAKGGITGKPKCYIPMIQQSAGLFMAAAPDPEMAMDADLAAQLFEVVSDSVDESNNVVQLPVSEMTDCEYVFFLIKSPSTGEGIVSDGGINMNVTAIPTDEYLPVSLQYRPYTATLARDPSYAGNILEDGTKENRSYNGRTVTASNESDLDRLLEIRAALPDAKIIVAVESSNTAQCFHEFEEAADVIFWAAGSYYAKAYARILSGEVEPSGLLIHQMPLSMDTVETQMEDQPRDMECYTDSEGNTYDFCFGLNWSGVIDDERVKTYKVNPLTEPETEVIFG